MKFECVHTGPSTWTPCEACGVHLHGAYHTTTLGVLQADAAECLPRQISSTVRVCAGGVGRWLLLTSEPCRGDSESAGAAAASEGDPTLGATAMAAPWPVLRPPSVRAIEIGNGGRGGILRCG